MTVLEAKILETIVTPNADGAVVQIQISDAPLDAEAWAIRLTLAVQGPLARRPLLDQVQHDAIDQANTALAALLRDLKEKIATGR